MKALAVFCAAVWLTVSAAGDSLDPFLFTVQRDGRECGSGFLMKDRDGVWMVSNCHVVRSEGEIVFKGMLDSSRRFELADLIEVAQNRDAVRFRTDEPAGLALAADASFDEAVCAYGNSDGLGVVTRSEGKVVGKGRGEIEITCEIIPGNSGGPVVNRKDEVIGIAAFGITMPAVKTAAKLSGNVSAAERERLLEQLKDRFGTRYLQTRRFALPLHDAQWQTVNRDVFERESAAFIRMDDRYDLFNEAVRKVFRGESLPESAQDLFPRSWLRNYNRDLSEYGYLDAESGRFYLRSGRQDAFHRAFVRWLRTLSESAASLAQELQAEQEELTVRYYRNELAEKMGRLQVSQSDLQEMADKYAR